MRIVSLLCVYFMVLGSQGLVLVPAPVNPKVLSNNFIHILQWSPGEGTQPGTVYNVKIVNNQAQSINGTSIDISEYMKDKFLGYNIYLWASFGNSSSSTVNIPFTPYTSTIIGPPRLSLSGCGDCLKISIDLPNRQGVFDSFYNAVRFDIEWTKASNEKDDCHSPLTVYQSKRSVDYSYVLRYLEPGVRYCVKAKPRSSSISASLSSCSCEFTSRTEPRGVAFLAGWVVGSLLVGLCFLSFILSLVYSGFLCKSNIKLPKALIILVPGYFISPEEACISVVEVEYGIQVHQPKDHDLGEKKEKGNAVFKSDGDDVDEDNNDDAEEDNESHHGYMDRAVHCESESTGSTTSVYEVYEVAENPDRCSFEDTPTDAKETLQAHSLLQSDRVKGYDQAALLGSVATNLNHPNASKGKILKGRMKDEAKEEDSWNVNLWSVVLKSMQPEEDEADEPSEAKKPLLPLLLKELQEDSLSVAKPTRGSSSELHTALLFHTQTSQEDENDVSDASMCEHVQTGYMASHTGTIGTGSHSSDHEEEDCTSGYMAR